MGLDQKPKERKETSHADDQGRMFQKLSNMCKGPEAGT